MDKLLHISIVDKRATYLGTEEIICNNSDYVAVFAFDSDWDEFEVKTARFKWNNDHVDVPFKGNRCEVPPVTGTARLVVTVYAGNIRTTTGANVPCKLSGLCGGSKPVPPRDDVYDHIVGLCNEAVSKADDVKRRADSGEFDGSDYTLTEQDVAAIVDRVLNALPYGDEEVY